MPGLAAQGGLHYLLDTFKFPAIGEITFSCNSSEIQWVVPAGITSVSAVLVGGGGGGGAGGNQAQRSGGGGGGLRYVNGLIVAPGETLKIKAGLGGTGHSTNPGPFGFGNNNTYKLNNPGFDSYIASDNNSTNRVGLAGTIIVIAGAGGTFPIPSASDFNNEWYVALKANNASTVSTQTVRYKGGGGTTPGIYSFGTIAGGNGGDGGQGTGGNGGGMDGGGGGAAGWITGTFGGNGAYYTGNQATSYVIATNGAAGGGGGGNSGNTGGAYGGGGGGGVGIRWGIGPNGYSGAYNSSGQTDTAFGQPAQGGSFGNDGYATGNELVSFSGYFDSAPYPSNYTNNSTGNGLRAFNSNRDPTPTGEVPSKPGEGSGGTYGGGGGGAQGSGTGGGFSGNGGCGVVRILWVARTQQKTRNYPGSFNTTLTIQQNVDAGWSGIGTTNILSSYGFPTLPPAAGGPNLLGP
jgi:hypothetical protein